MCLPRKIAFHTRRICTCHAKLRWRSPKCCVCHKKCNSSSETDAKVLRLPQNDDRHVCRHMRMTGSATPATQNHITTENLMLENATPLRKSSPPSSDEHVSCTAPARKMHLCRSSSNVPRLPSFFANATTPSRSAHF